MDSQTIRTLEFHRIQEILKRYSQSPLGHSRIDALTVHNDRDAIQYLLNCVDEMAALIRDRGRPSLHGCSDISPLLKEIGVEGSFLRAKDLIPVRNVIHAAQDLKGFVGKEPDTLPLLQAEVARLDSLPELGVSIERTIDDRGQIKDSASKKLERIRRQIRQQKEHIKERLEGILLSEGLKTVVQERLVTVRNDRYVIPLKPDFSSKIQGIIHDQSSSGVTVFVEPSVTVEMNNRLSRLSSEEAEEIHRILLEISDRVREAGAPLQKNVDILAGMDLHLSKALFAEEYHGVIPEIRLERKIDFKKARHPLLLEKRLGSKSTKVVPIDLKLGEEVSTLIITGPNTGGKTVALKTLGLLVLMVQAGIPIPVAEGSSMGIFQEVLADIGDEQSIQEDLSTFSSHIQNIVRILHRSGPESLALLDELGTGTDPREGAALGMAILEDLHQKGCLTAATTHYEEIKHYAYRTSGMMNASVAFDAVQLQPGFVLEYGHLGTSHAFEISRRIGMPERILQGANEKISGLDKNTARLLEELEETIRTNQTEHEKLQRQRLEIERLSSVKEEEKGKILKEAQQTLAKAREQFQRTKKRARTLLKIAEEGNRKRFEQEVRKIEEEIPAGPVPPERLPEGIDLRLFRPGFHVEILGTGEKGVILSDPDKQKRVLVLCNGIRMNVSVGRLKRSAGGPIETGTRIALKTEINSHEEISQSINLIGLRVEEAKEKTEKYIDRAHLENLRSVKIIHGIGTGALRNAVEGTLRAHPLASDFRAGDRNEGGAGVTVVELV